jgi:hypothetical protein
MSRARTATAPAVVTTKRRFLVVVFMGTGYTPGERASTGTSRRVRLSPRPSPSRVEPVPRQRGWKRWQGATGPGVTIASHRGFLLRPACPPFAPTVALQGGDGINNALEGETGQGAPLRHPAGERQLLHSERSPGEGASGGHRPAGINTGGGHRPRCDNYVAPGLSHALTARAAGPGDWPAAPRCP